MKKRKFKVLLSLILGAVVMFTGCSSGGDDSTGPNYNVSMNISYEEFKEGDIIKNKVLTTGTGNMSYYEYLTFTSSNEGTYSLYSFVHQNDATSEGIDEYTKLSENPFAEGKALPEEFTYDSEKGAITLEINGKSVTTYFFKLDSKAFAAQECLSPVTGNDKNSLFRGWKTQDGQTFTFSDGGKVSYKKTDESEAVQASYTNNDGVILVNSSIPFCWTKTASENNLFYNARETERKSVTAEGRNISSKTEIEFITDGLMFARVQ